MNRMTLWPLLLAATPARGCRTRSTWRRRSCSAPAATARTAYPSNRNTRSSGARSISTSIRSCATMRAGRRDSTIMTAILRRLRHATRPRHWPSTSPARTWPRIQAVGRGRRPAARRPRGRRRQCSACHGIWNGNSDVPRLTGQQSGYLSQTMLDFKHEVRMNAPDKISTMQKLDDAPSRRWPGISRRSDAATDRAPLGSSRRTPDRRRSGRSVGRLRDPHRAQAGTRPSPHARAPRRSSAGSSRDRRAGADLGTGLEQDRGHSHAVRRRRVVRVPRRPHQRGQVWPHTPSAPPRLPAARRRSRDRRGRRHRSSPPCRARRAHRCPHRVHQQSGEAAIALEGRRHQRRDALRSAASTSAPASSRDAAVRRSAGAGRRAGAASRRSARDGRRPRPVPAARPRSDARRLRGDGKRGRAASVARLDRGTLVEQSAAISGQSSAAASNSASWSSRPSPRSAATGRSGLQHLADVAVRRRRGGRGESSASAQARSAIRLIARRRCR